MDLAVAITVDGSGCRVIKLGSKTPIEAELSKAMAKRRIWVRPGDLVRVNVAATPVEVMYRWRRATVIAVNGDGVSVATAPSDDDLSLSAYAFLLPGFGPAPVVGDTVFLDVRHRSPVVVDIARGDEPSHPERFGDEYTRIREAIRAMRLPAPRAPGTPAPPRMHADELEVNEALVRRLLRSQTPAWADLSLRRVRSAGTDNAMYRLGEDMVVRIPRIGWAVNAVEHEHRWLPVVAPHLPLAVPVPLWKGEPGEGYPWPWSIYSWLDGEDATRGAFSDTSQAAKDLARFITALRSIDTTDAPEPSRASLANVDGPFRRSIAAARGLVDIDVDAVTAAWEAALRVPGWEGPPVWVHGDLDGRNLLVRDGRIFAVLDWSGVGLGDPARDVAAAWDLFDAKSREAFRAELDVDDATWERSRGWTLMGIEALNYYRDTNPALARQARRQIATVLDEPAPQE